MWRPRNETASNLAVEEMAKAYISASWGYEITKLSETLYGLDWCLSQNKIPVAWGEFKDRGRAYPDYLLSASKYDRGVRLAKCFGIPFLLFIGVNESIIYADLCIVPVLRTELAGSSRGQNGDIEPCVFFSAKEFREVSDKGKP